MPWNQSQTEDTSNPTEKKHTGTERLCVVMPVYNEREAIGGVLAKWNAALAALDIDYEIRAYNDGSRDGTLAVMQEAAERLGKRVSVRDKPNGGHGPTILQGYREAAADGFDWIFQVDSDDEMGPERFRDLWERRGTFDFLAGRRAGRMQAWPRRCISFVSRCSVRALYGTGGIWDVNTPYRLMRVAAFRRFYAAIPPDTFAPNVILGGLAARHGLRCLELPVSQHDRTTGEVSIRKWKLLKAAIKSFGQTMAFGMSENMRGRDVVDWASLLSVLAGLFLTLLLALSPGRALSTAVWGAFLWVACRRGRISNAWHGLSRWADRHAAWIWGLLFGVGTAERWVSAWRHPELLDQWLWGNRHHDYIQLWDAAQQWGMDRFWLTKSWATVWYYGSFVKLFGTDLHRAYWGTALLYAASAILAFALVSKCAGRVAGWVAAFAVYAAPALVRHSANIATEHVFVFSVLVALWLAGRTISAKGAISAMLLGLATGAGCWLATWSRGEGVLLWILLPVWILAWHVRRGAGLRTGLLAAIAMGMVFSAGAWQANRVNLAQHGMGGIFCSNDNYWPRLMGCNLATRGHFNHEDVAMVSARCREIEPDCGDPPPERLFVPVIREEVRSRWTAMTPTQIAGLMCHKTFNSWCVDWPAYDGTSPTARTASAAITYALPGLCLLFGWIWFWRLFRRWLGGGRLDGFFLVLAMPLFAGMQFGLLLVAESMWRYGYLFHVFWGMFGAMGIAGKLDFPQKTSRKTPAARLEGVARH